MGVTDREQSIIDLYERGYSPADIADNLGMSLGYVKSRISNLCSNLGPDLRHVRAMEAGCRELRIAVKTLGGYRT